MHLCPNLQVMRGARGGIIREDLERTQEPSGLDHPWSISGTPDGIIRVLEQLARHWSIPGKEGGAATPRIGSSGDGSRTRGKRSKKPPDGSMRVGERKTRRSRRAMHLDWTIEQMLRARGWSTLNAHKKPLHWIIQRIVAGPRTGSSRVESNTAGTRGSRRKT